MSHEPERPEEALGIRVHDRMPHHFTLEEAVLFLGRQGAVNEQVRGLQVRGLERKLLDWVAPGPDSVSPGPSSPRYCTLTCSGGLRRVRAGPGQRTRVGVQSLECDAPPASPSM